VDRKNGVRRASTLLATLGPVGYWPVGPGTLASALVTLLWAAAPWPRAVWLGVALLWTAAGIPAAHRAERELGHDDGRIVIDEAAGMSLTLLAAPRGWPWAGFAFVLFRLFDIVKPPPVGRLQRLSGGWGIMLDDLAAGALAALLIMAASRVEIVVRLLGA
jgi:phosphatidylglycerophosphatase A